MATRFVMVSRDNMKNFGYVAVLVDRLTRVQYAFAGEVDRGGLTVLLDADGTPMLYEGTLPN